MNNLTFNFNLLEIMALIGLVQSVYILVFMALRSNRLTRGTLPFLFFTSLAMAFFLSLAESRWETELVQFSQVKWLLWTISAPLSALLILQIARVTKAPSLPFWGVFFLIPCAYFTSSILEYTYGQKEMWLHVSAVIVGAISLLTIWGERDVLTRILQRKNGKERYWLIVALICLNLALIFVNLLLINSEDNLREIELVRNVLGISFVYIVSTSLFRIYPQAVSLIPENDDREGYLTDSEVDIAMKIENLLHLEKVYHEASYKRSDLARELDISDAHLSKIVNIYFEKSVPQLLNTYRVEDAKYLLKETDADVTVISEEAGFNSIATFNRVFKEMEGVSPSEFRMKQF